MNAPIEREIKLRFDSAAAARESSSVVGRSG